MAEGLTSEQTNQIADELASGSKIGAIKLYREFTGKGLKEAKDFIELLIPELMRRDPAKYARLAQQGKGCVSVAAACLAFSTGAVILLFR